VKLITSMSAKQAKEFFLKSENYFNFDLPKYFDFDSILKLSNDLITNKNFKSYIINNLPNKYENVDYLILHNKDGKYAWRPFELIHPILYVKLVNDICNEKNWNVIVQRLKQMHKNPKIICCSMPGESEQNKNIKKENILKWWNDFEQKSISSSIDYSLVAITDITNCYPSIYTHSISWALHTKEVAKSNIGNYDLVGNLIDSDICQMRYGQTNGIPQGSVLMDLIAEIVLGYADEQLSKTLQENDIEDYKIIRYRDDYRIFCNNDYDLERIMKNLSEVLTSLNFKINSLKTNITNNIVIESLKKDKVARFKMSDIEKLNIQKQLFLIDEFSKSYQNSGSVVTLLTNLFKSKIEKLKKRPNSYEQVISIILDIMYSNPRTYPICIAILSHIFKYLSKDKVNQYIQKIVQKFKVLPNTVYLEVWLQRITIVLKRDYEYSHNSICEKIYNSNNHIWNSDWLKENIKQQFDENLIINENEIKKIKGYIDRKEVDAFSSNIDYLE
jgi:RNA-directed DNA polymerase